MAKLRWNIDVIAFEMCLLAKQWKKIINERNIENVVHFFIIIIEKINRIFFFFWSSVVFLSVRRFHLALLKLSWAILWDIFADPFFFLFHIKRDSETNKKKAKHLKYFLLQIFATFIIHPKCYLSFNVIAYIQMLCDTHSPRKKNWNISCFLPNIFFLSCFDWPSNGTLRECYHWML